jgi:hypothetical protein
MNRSVRPRSRPRNRKSFCSRASKLDYEDENEDEGQLRRGRFMASTRAEISVEAITAQ